jgi:ribA/ribD-fused uncharacterized protein
MASKDETPRHPDCHPRRFPQRNSTEKENSSLPIMHAARKLNVNTVVNADKLCIISKDADGKEVTNVYDVKSLHRLPPALDPKFVMTEKTEHVFAFFGSLCPLSNFHQSPFTCEGKTFRFMEEYLFYKKAEFAGDDVSMQNVLEADTPAECKSIGRNIKVDSKRWYNRENTVMAKGLHEKFSQNPHLKKYLKDTGDLLLAEASLSDRYWGTGVGLGKTDTTKQAVWKGKNKLGQLLMQLRTEYK